MKIAFLMATALFLSSAGAALSTQEVPNTRMEIIINGVSFSAVLNDGKAASAFRKRLPATIKMADLNDNEKYAYLPETFPRNEERVGTIQTGDIMLYGKDCLVLFYKDFRTSYRYTRIGRITNPEHLRKALGKGEVSVSFRMK